MARLALFDRMREFALHGFEADCEVLGIRPSVYDWTKNEYVPEVVVAIHSNDACLQITIRKPEYAEAFDASAFSLHLPSASLSFKETPSRELLLIPSADMQGFLDWANKMLTRHGQPTLREMGEKAERERAAKKEGVAA